MRAWLVGLLVVAVILSGCSSKNDSGGDATTPAPTTGSATTTGPAPTTTGGPTTSGAAPTTGGGSNHAPTASLAASTEGGALPLLVNFTLDANDIDGDNLEWTFDADSDGTAEEEGTDADLPAEVSFTYEETGTFSATFNVTDRHEFAIAVVALEVTATTFSGQSVMGEWLAGSLVHGCLSDFVLESPNYPAELDGVAYASFDIDPASYGFPFTFDISSPAPFTDPGLTMLDAEGGILYDSVGVVSETVPAGAVKGYFWACDGAMMTGTYESGPGVVPAS